MVPMKSNVLRRRAERAFAEASAAADAGERVRLLMLSADLLCRANGCGCVNGEHDAACLAELPSERLPGTG